MFSSRFSEKFKYVLAVLILAPLCVYAASAKNPSFHRRVLDRISVLYLMGNDMEKSISVQRRAMKPQYQTDISAETRADVTELVKLLKENNENLEAETWQKEFANLSGDTESIAATTTAVSEVVKEAVETETVSSQENKEETAPEKQEAKASEEEKIVKIERRAGRPFTRELPDSFRLRVRTDNYTEAPPVTTEEPAKPAEPAEEKTEAINEENIIESPAAVEPEKTIELYKSTESDKNIESEKNVEPVSIPEETASSDGGKSILKKLLEARIDEAKIRNEEQKARRIAQRKAEKQAAEKKTESKSEPEVKVEVKVEAKAEPKIEKKITKPAPEQPQKQQVVKKITEPAVAEARPAQKAVRKDSAKTPVSAETRSKQSTKKRSEVQTAQKKAKPEKVTTKTPEEEWLPDYKLQKEKRSTGTGAEKDGAESYRHSKPLFPQTANAAVSTNTPGKSVIISSAPDLDQLKALSDTKVSLNFRDADLADIVRMLAAKGNLNIVSRNPIKGKTTVNFEDIQVGRAIDIILRTNDYLYEIKDGVLWIFSRGEEPEETRVFFVRNALAADILPMIQQALGQTPDVLQRSTDSNSGNTSAANGNGNSSSTSAGATGTDPMSGTGVSAQSSDMGSGMSDSSAGSSSSTPNSQKSKVYLDEKSNSLIVTAPFSKLNEIAKLIEVYDSRSSSRLEERVFKLMYIDKKTLEDAIKMVIPSFDPAKQMFEVQRSSQATSGGTSGATTRR